MVVAVFEHAVLFQRSFHVEITAVRHESVTPDFPGNFVAIVGQHKVRKCQVAFCTADVCPLLVVGAEGIVEGGRHTICKMQFALKFQRHHLIAVGPLDAVQDSPAHFSGQFVVHCPENDADRVPAKVSQTAGRFQLAAGADITLHP